MSPIGPFIHLIDDSSQIPNVDATVAKIAPNGCWDINHFINVLPTPVVQQICSFHLSINDSEDDSLV